MPKLQSIRTGILNISSKGIQVFPRIKTPEIPPSYEIAQNKISTGVEGMDEMFEGGIPKGTATLIAGGAGTGKTGTSNRQSHQGACVN